ncbi:MAG TPA: hypothetical protein VIJ47_13790 [Acidimicrobiales bacterium]
MVKGRWSAILAMVVLCSAAMVTTATPAAAVGSCASGFSNYFAGYTGYSRPPASWNETPEGTSAYIVTRDGPVCTNKVYPNTFSTTWVMLQAGGSKYAQAGFIRDQNCNRYFTEYDNGSPSFSRNINQSYCVPYGSQHTYRVLYNGPPGAYPPPGGTLAMYTDGLTVNSFIDPWASGWSMIPSYSGETTDLVNDVPGAAWAWTDMPAMGIQSVDTGALRSTPCYLTHAAPGGPRYFSNASGCDHTWSWTDPF